MLNWDFRRSWRPYVCTQARVRLKGAPRRRGACSPDGVRTNLTPSIASGHGRLPWGGETPPHRRTPAASWRISSPVSRQQHRLRPVGLLKRPNPHMQRNRCPIPANPRECPLGAFQRDTELSRPGRTATPWFLRHRGFPLMYSGGPAAGAQHARAQGCRPTRAANGGGFSSPPLAPARNVTYHLCRTTAAAQRIINHNVFAAATTSAPPDAARSAFTAASAASWFRRSVS